MTQSYPTDTVEERNHETNDAIVSSKPEKMRIAQFRIMTALGDSMNMRDPKLTALAFNEYINARDLAGLTSLMTESHTFIDSGNIKHRGKAEMTEGWGEFFTRYPDYTNIFTTVCSQGNLVVMLGYSTCSNEPELMVRRYGPLLWRTIWSRNGGSMTIPRKTAGNSIFSDHRYPASLLMETCGGKCERNRHTGQSP